MIQWLYVHLGVAGSGPWYGFWSGFGSDIGEVTIIAGMIAIYRKHTCHVGRCWRLGKHTVDGTPYVVCRKHHPAIDAAPTARDITAAHTAAQGDWPS